jgi:cytochrome b561
MPLLNSSAGYGSLTKALHWIIVALFAWQLGSAVAMTRLDDDAARDALYNWHKTLGLVALAVALVRIRVRAMGELPPWAPTLTEMEKRIIHRAEQGLYVAMVLMPLSGLLHVMAGGYGVLLAGTWALPNPIGEWKPLGEVGRVVHLLGAIGLGVALAAHLGVVLRHTLVLRDGLIRRMLPARR